jgi:hypothetical protein
VTVARALAAGAARAGPSAAGTGAAPRLAMLIAAATGLPRLMITVALLSDGV